MKWIQLLPKETLVAMKLMTPFTGMLGIITKALNSSNPGTIICNPECNADLRNYFQSMFLVHAMYIDVTFASLSRQRYVLGDNAMQKMARSSVFLSGLGGLGIEIGKT